MKKVLALLLSVLMVLSLVGCGSEFAGGTFEGSAKGFLGDVNVKLTLNEEKVITAIEASSEETPDIGGKAIDVLIEKVTTANTTDVEIVSSATYSSEAFLAACNAALEAAGLKASDLKKVDTNVEVKEETLDTDIVIIGAGGAGMTAAITAAQAGKSVIIVEKGEITGGNSSRATGGMNAADTALQDKNEFEQAAGVEKVLEKAKEFSELNELAATVAKQWADYQASPEGYFDTYELYMLDTIVGGHNVNNYELVKTFANNTAAGVEWLAGLDTPIELTSVGSFGGASVKRIHRPVDADGKTMSVGSYMIPLLQKNCEDLGVKIYMATKANEILLTDGAASGIKASSDTTNYTINAKSVIVATGGFAANIDLVVNYKPEYDGFITTNAATITGDGIKMAEAVGANLVDMEQIQIHPTVHQETGKMITEGLRGDGAILVNQEGVRFCDELGTRDVVSGHELKQTGSYAYLIVDQKMVDKSAVIGKYIKGGLTISGGDLKELATAMGCDEATLTTTLETWNNAVTSGNDAEFGRTSFAETLDTAPYYAIKIAPGVHHTMGGIEIDTNTEVLDTKGAVIPGLYAAGEVTGGVHGGNRLGGNAVADFVVFGRIAGEAAANYAK